MSVNEHSVSTCTAQVFDPEEPADHAVLQRLRADLYVDFIDRREQQLANLRRLRPSPDPELVAEPCRWAYYPWRRTVVAVLGPRAFRAVRLDRNRNIITTQEQARLGAVSIGVVGLSAGHVIAHMLAAEGLCGLLRLADFDRIELSNLNRVPATILDLGLNKAQVAARRIAELDPYLPVQVFEAELMFDNVGEFLDGLDIVIEECDSLDMKVILRDAARDRRIPVLMATSDRGLVDVERFDLEPQRPILHGLLGELDVGLLPRMNSGEKVPYIIRQLDAQRLSPRMAASMVEIDRSVSTWPQLAGELALGSATLAEAVRRIALGEDLCSGRIRIDIGWALNQIDEPEIVRNHPPPQPDHVEPALPRVPGVICAAAIRAPSGGNMQPWHINAGRDAVTILLAPERTSTMDVGFRASAVALGAALFNAKVAAAAYQVLGPVTLTEDAGAPLQATLRLGDGGDLDLAGLYQPMLARETNRNKGTPSPIADDTIELVHMVAEREGAVLHVLTARDEIARAAVLLAAADRTRYLTPRLHAEMISELRWPGDPSPDTGIDVRSLELDPGDLAVLDVLRRPDVVAHLARWNTGTTLGDYTKERVLDSSALAVVTVTGDTLTDHARGGSAAEAVWITAQQHGLTVQPISPVFLYAHSVGDLNELSTTFAKELGQLQIEFRELAHARPGESPVLVLRFAAGGPTSVRSRRSHDRVRLIAG